MIHDYHFDLSCVSKCKSWKIPEEVDVLLVISIFYHLFRVRFWEQQFEKRCPDFPGPSHLLQLNWRDPKAFPGQLRDVIPLAYPGSPPSRTCPEHLFCNPKGTRTFPPESKVLLSAVSSPPAPWCRFYWGVRGVYRKFWTISSYFFPMLWTLRLIQRCG